MIVDELKNITALDILRKAPYHFYPTGSRYFTPSTVGPTTDWDFFAENSVDLRDFLESQGFEDITPVSYRDKDCIFVYRKENVDVQLRTDVIDWKRKQHRLMNLSEIHRKILLDKRLDRATLTKMWNEL